MAARQYRIITSYNDMLSDHQPYRACPELIRRGAKEAGGVAQVAGSVPAMCDSVTQGDPGMEMSLFSRDVIAMSTAIGLSHNVYDAALMLSICDKIIPIWSSARYNTAVCPTIFVPADPMTFSASRMPRKRKSVSNMRWAKRTGGALQIPP